MTVYEKVCLHCYKPFEAPRRARTCSDVCRQAYSRDRRARLGPAVRKMMDLPPAFSYVHTTGKVIRKPIEAHVYHPKNELKLDDRTNYYRGNGIFGYDNPVPGQEERPEWDIE